MFLPLKTLSDSTTLSSDSLKLAAQLLWVGQGFWTKLLVGGTVPVKLYEIIGEAGGRGQVPCQGRMLNGRC